MSGRQGEVVKKAWDHFVGALYVAVLFTIGIWAPLLAVALLIHWPEAFSWAAVFAFFGLCVAVVFVWNVVLSVVGFYRLVLYRVWRPGWKPCMCDQRYAYCHRHRSSSREPNRPGVVAEKLREDS
jgi:hypothetical protein